MAQDLLTLVANLSPGISLVTQSFLPDECLFLYLASSHGDGLITGRFTFLQVQAMNAYQIEAIVQFVEKKTDVLVNLPTGFEKSLTKCLVCV